MGIRAGIRLGPDPPGWGAPVPSAQQPATPDHQPEGDQPAAADVTGKSRARVRKQTNGAPSERAGPDFVSDRSDSSNVHSPSKYTSAVLLFEPFF